MGGSFFFFFVFLLSFFFLIFFFFVGLLSLYDYDTFYCLGMFHVCVLNGPTKSMKPIWRWDGGAFGTPPILFFFFFFKSLFLFFLYIYTYIYYSFPSFSMYEPLCALYDQLPKRAGIQICRKNGIYYSKFAKLPCSTDEKERKKGKKKIIRPHKICITIFSIIVRFM
jgi:hypothetical protein